MLVPLKPVLDAARRGGYAQGAFNVNAVCQAKAVIEIHETFRSPAILQGADLANAFMGGRADFANGTVADKIVGARNIGEAVRRFGAESPIPVVLHLDHGHDMESVRAAVEGGYTSVMIDGSALPFGENMELTREVVLYAHERGVSVEGELGVLAGVEDDVSSLTSTYTNPLAAVEFVRNTKVDALAISYGTMHGASKGKDVKLRREIPIAVRECLLHEGLDCALVSHGSSTVPRYIVDEINALGGSVSNAHGIPIAELKAAIPCGISKINVDTDIRLAVTRNLRELFERRPELRESESVGGVWRLLDERRDQVDPRAFLPPVFDTVMEGVVPDADRQALVDAIEAGVREAVGTLVVEFGSFGKAPLIERVGLDEMAAVLNASLYGAVTEALATPGVGRVLGARGGMGGVLSGDFIDFSQVGEGELGLLPRSPSSAIGTSRRPLDAADYARIAEGLGRADVRWLLCCGGNGTMDTCGKVWAACRDAGVDVGVVGIPKTMDNDLAACDHAPGYGSAARYLAAGVSEVCADVRGLPIHIVVVEAMGRNAGWVTAASSLAAEGGCGGPDLIYLPERDFDERAFLDDAQRLIDERGAGVVVVSEGIHGPGGASVVPPLMQVGRATYFGDVSAYLAQLVIRELGYKARSEKPGLFGRASIAWQSDVDREEAIACGREAVRAATSGDTGVMVGIQRISTEPYEARLDRVPIERVMLEERTMPDGFINERGNGVTESFCRWARPLIGGALPRHVSFT